MRHFRKV